MREHLIRLAIGDAIIAIVVGPPLIAGLIWGGEAAYWTFMGLAIGLVPAYFLGATIRLFMSD